MTEMRTKVLVRQGRPEDAETIASFQEAMAWETEELKLDAGTVRLGVKAVFDNASLGRYFVAEIDGRVVGSLLIAYEWSDWRNGLVWWIHSVYAVPECRGQGVFSSLYSHIRSLVETDPKLRGLRLYVEKSNQRAQAIYRKLGMTDEHYDLFEWLK